MRSFWPFSKPALARSCAYSTRGRPVVVVSVFLSSSFQMFFIFVWFLIASALFPGPKVCVCAGSLWRGTEVRKDGIGANGKLIATTFGRKIHHIVPYPRLQG